MQIHAGDSGRHRHRLEPKRPDPGAAALCVPGTVLHTAYGELRETVRAFSVINTDDTAWRIGGAGAFLMGFFTPLPAVFQIR